MARIRNKFYGLISRADIVRVCKINRQTLLNYCDLGLITPVSRSSKKFWYSPTVIPLISRIKKLNGCYTLTEIRDILYEK